MAVLILSCEGGEGAALVAATAALVALTGEVKRRWAAEAVQRGRKPDRRSGSRGTQRR